MLRRSVGWFVGWFVGAAAVDCRFNLYGADLRRFNSVLFVRTRHVAVAMRSCSVLEDRIEQVGTHFDVKAREFAPSVFSATIYRRV